MEFTSENHLLTVDVERLVVVVACGAIGDNRVSACGVADVGAHTHDVVEGTLVVVEHGLDAAAEGEVVAAGADGAPPGGVAAVEVEAFLVIMSLATQAAEGHVLEPHIGAGLDQSVVVPIQFVLGGELDIGPRARAALGGLGGLLGAVGRRYAVDGAVGEHRGNGNGAGVCLNLDDAVGVAGGAVGAARQDVAAVDDKEVALGAHRVGAIGGAGGAAYGSAGTHGGGGPHGGEVNLDTDGGALEVEFLVGWHQVAHGQGGAAGGRGVDRAAADAVETPLVEAAEAGGSVAAGEGGPVIVLRVDGRTAREGVEDGLVLDTAGGHSGGGLAVHALQGLVVLEGVVLTLLLRDTHTHIVGRAAEGELGGGLYGDVSARVAQVGVEGQVARDVVGAVAAIGDLRIHGVQRAQGLVDRGGVDGPVVGLEVVEHHLALGRIEAGGLDGVEVEVGHVHKQRIAPVAVVASADGTRANIIIFTHRQAGEGGGGGGGGGGLEAGGEGSVGGELHLVLAGRALPGEVEGSIVDAGDGEGGRYRADGLEVHRGPVGIDAGSAHGTHRGGIGGVGGEAGEGIRGRVDRGRGTAIEGDLPLGNPCGVAPREGGRSVVGRGRKGGHGDAGGGGEGMRDGVGDEAAVADGDHAGRVGSVGSEAGESIGGVVGGYRGAAIKRDPPLGGKAGLGPREGGRGVVGSGSNICHGVAADGAEGNRGGGGGVACAANGAHGGGVRGVGGEAGEGVVGGGNDKGGAAVEGDLPLGGLIVVVPREAGRGVVGSSRKSVDGFADEIRILENLQVVYTADSNAGAAVVPPNGDACGRRGCRGEIHLDVSAIAGRVLRAAAGAVAARVGIETLDGDKARGVVSSYITDGKRSERARTGSHPAFELEAIQGHGERRHQRITSGADGGVVLRWEGEGSGVASSTRVIDQI